MVAVSSSSSAANWNGPGEGGSVGGPPIVFDLQRKGEREKQRERARALDGL